VIIPVTEQVPLSSLKGADYNPREMPGAEMTKLMRSLQEFGFVEPIVARREDGLIVGGHQRAEAMRRLSPGTDPQVPVVYLDGLSDERAMTLNLALNKIHGEWDYQKLSEVLGALSDFPEVELSGFGAHEIEDILTLAGQAPPDTGAGDVDVDKELEARARRFQFEVPTIEEAHLCIEVLQRFGMAGPKSASAAFVALVKAAKVQLP